MGTVYRKTVTRPLPAGAEIIIRKGQRLARWKRNGKARTAPIIMGRDGSERIADTAATFTAKYRDGNRHVVEVATGCRDIDAARRVLAELERRAELVKAKVLTANENAVSGHQDKPLGTHFNAYRDYLVAKGTSEAHRKNVRRQLNRLATECLFFKLADLGRDALGQWLAVQAKAKMGARTRNTYLAAAMAFSNWCVETGRLVANPFAKVARADEKSDCKRKRRALTQAELVKLLDVARQRPLAEFGRLTDRKPADEVKRKRDTWKAAALKYDELDAATDRARERLKDKPASIARLERLGRERALIYKTLVLTGLRRGELASLKVGQLDLASPMPCIVLEAADEKNREGSTLPLRSDLAADLAAWTKELQQCHSGEASESDGPACLPIAAARKGRLPADTPLFNVPDKLVKVLDRDLKLAGIPKADERGRTIDVHAMRHTFGSLLSKGGVAPRTAQAAMRHAKIDLTMNVYTDPKVLDVAGALDALPTLPLDAPNADRQEQRATGTDHAAAILVAPTVAPNIAPRCKLEPSADNFSTNRGESAEPASDDVSCYAVKRKHPSPILANGCQRVGDTGLEPVTPSLSSRGDRVLSGDGKELAASDDSRCTTGCTSEDGNANAGPSERFADDKPAAEPAAIDRGLATVVTAWSSLPELIRRAIIAMVEAAG